MFVTLARALDIAIEIFVLLIIIRAVLSFFPQMDRGHPLVRTLDQVVEPVLRPFQRLMPNMGGLDFSPILAILTLQIVGGILTRFIAGLGRGIFYGVSTARVSKRPRPLPHGRGTDGESRREAPPPIGGGAFSG